jgi:predicted transcriptional regulator
VAVTLRQNCMTRHILSVQITDELDKALAEHAKRTLIPTSAFVRRAIENALDPKTGVDAQIDAQRVEAERP